MAALGPTDTECLEVDGVGWIPQSLSDGTRFTSFGTDPAVEVLVPKTYAPEPLLLPVFAPVAKALPAQRPRLPLTASPNFPARCEKLHLRPGTVVVRR